MAAATLDEFATRVNKHDTKGKLAGLTTCRDNGEAYVQVPVERQPEPP
jgi:hypothetical protein